MNVSKVKRGIVPCSSTLSAFTFDLMSVEHYSLAMLTLLLSFLSLVGWSACCARVVAPLDASAVPFVPES